MKTEGQQGSSEMPVDADAEARSVAADLELIDSFLTNRLSRNEQVMVETKIVANPQFKLEIELTEAMREGMRELSRQGEIAPLVTSVTSVWRRTPVAVAAAVIAGLLAVNSLLLYQRPDQAEQTLIAASNRPADSTLAAPIRTEALRFVQTRGAQDTSDVSWHRSRLPTLLELHFDVGLEPAQSYQVTIEHLASDRHATVLVVSQIAINAAQEIVFAVHGALLVPGDYRVHIEPQPDSAQYIQPVTYSLHVAD